MRYTNSENEKARPQENRAAVFIDYHNLCSHLQERLGKRERPDELIRELIDELRRYLLEETRTRTALLSAYADFSVMGSGVQRSLYLQGVEPRFVPSAVQANAAEIQLCVDAVDLLHTRPDLRTFVVVTGDRPYLPLVQQFKRYGNEAFVVSFAPPPATTGVPHGEEATFLDAANLLGETGRRLFAPSAAAREAAPAETPATRPVRSEPVAHLEITSRGALQALEIIEEYFGQYEEVYLTPLLRKLSELLDEELYDPKTLISELEEAGAVWLEKRRGFPYDYTVLLIDSNHPDVVAIQQDLYEREQRGENLRPYEDDEEEEEGEETDYYEEEYDDYEEEEEEEEEYVGEFEPSSKEDASGDLDGEYVDAEED